MVQEMSNFCSEFCDPPADVAVAGAPDLPEWFTGYLELCRTSESAVDRGVRLAIRVGPALQGYRGYCPAIWMALTEEVSAEAGSSLKTLLSLTSSV